MNNVAYGKPTTSSHFVKPFSSNRAVDGSTQPLNRWLANAPCTLTVDLLKPTWVNRWAVYQMGAIGWQSPSYNIKNYSLQGSLDGQNWTIVDTVSNNTASISDRTFQAIQYRFFRLAFSSGLNINPKLVSVSEFAIYEAPPTSSYLQSLSMSEGNLSPSFSSTIFEYTVDVEADINQIMLTPTSIDGATIKVNGHLVESGASSDPIILQTGLNEIDVVVTAKIGDAQSTYKIIVNRALNLYLKSLGLAYSGRGYSDSKLLTLNHTDVDYVDHIDVKAISVAITPITEDASLTITVSGQSVASGDTTNDISINASSNSIPIVVSKVDISEKRTYILDIKKS
jgi:hypothetical protein